MASDEAGAGDGEGGLGDGVEVGADDRAGSLSAGDVFEVGGRALDSELPGAEGQEGRVGESNLLDPDSFDHERA